MNNTNLKFKDILYHILDNGDIGNGWKYVEVVDKKGGFSLPKCLYYKGESMKNLLEYSDYINHLDTGKGFINDFVKDIFRECYPGSTNPICKIKENVMMRGGGGGNSKVAAPAEEADTTGEGDEGQTAGPRETDGTPVSTGVGGPTEVKEEGGEGDEGQTAGPRETDGTPVSTGVGGPTEVKEEGGEGDEGQTAGPRETDGTPVSTGVGGPTEVKEEGGEGDEGQTAGPRETDGTPVSTGVGGPTEVKEGEKRELCTIDQIVKTIESLTTSPTETSTELKKDFDRILKAVNKAGDKTFYPKKTTEE